MTGARWTREDRRAAYDRIADWAMAHLADLVTEAGVKLRRGRGRCPIHGGDNTDALSVRAGKGWKCWTGDCGGGDGVDFVRLLRYRGLERTAGRLEALRELAPRAGVYLDAWDGPPLPGVSARTSGRTPDISGDSRNLIKPDIAPVVPAHEQLLAELRADGCSPAAPSDVYAAALDALDLGDVGASYLAARGIEPEAAERYGFRAIGAREGWDALRDALRTSYLDAELCVAGFYQVREGKEAEGPVWAPAWHSRPAALVIPYYARGVVVGIRLRNLTPDTPHRARYRDLGGRRPPLPFNVDALASAGGEVHVAEGELNTLCLHLHGLPAIGLPGANSWQAEWTALVADAIASGSPMISAQSGRLVTWFDDDKGGAAGRARLATDLADAFGRRWLAQHGRAVTLDGGDVNDLHRAGTLGAIIDRRAWRD